jgi:hypothetical protein
MTPKSPKDPNRLAKSIIDIAMWEKPERLFDQGGLLLRTTIIGSKGG